MVDRDKNSTTNKNTDFYDNLSEEEKIYYDEWLKQQRQYENCIIQSEGNVSRTKDDFTRSKDIPDLSYCEPIFDGIHCWFATPVNTTVNKTCPIPVPEGENVPEGIYAFRFCQLDNEWENATNYNMCIDYIDSLQNDEKDKYLAMVLRDIYFVCSIVSLVLLIITLFIFSYFRSLQCSRISIHKNLVASFIFRFIMIIVMIEPFVTGRSSGSYRSFDWLCKTVLVMSQYPLVAIIFWMFVEGLFLHNRIVVAVFSTEAPFKLFLLIGWGFPALIVLAWVLTMSFQDQNYCWDHYSQSTYIYIIIAPFLLALIINLCFLINIIRVLVTKLKTNNSEAAQIKKAIKATIILMPLLGLTNLLFLWNPEDGSSLQTAYHLTNAILQSTQGIFVSVLYCFLNGEVRMVLRRKWDRFILRRFPGSNRRRRSSRTSSFILSQTESHAKSTTSNNNHHINNLLEHTLKIPETDDDGENNESTKLTNQMTGYNSDDSNLSNEIEFTLKDIDDVLNSMDTSDLSND